MHERNSSAVFGGFFLTERVMQATNLTVTKSIEPMHAGLGELKFTQDIKLGHEFLDFQGRNVESVHWIGQPALDAIQELQNSLESFWDSFDDGSLFDLGPEVKATAERISTLYPNLFKPTTA